MRQVQQARGQRAQWSRARAVNCVARVKLTYFNPPGRVETSRIMLSLAQIDFDDNRISREQWAEVKPTTPYGQLPVLEWHGKVLAQSNAIDRFLAKMTGHYPIESFEQARVDSIVSFTEEFFQLFAPLFSIEDPEAKAKAIKAVVEGPLAARLERLEKMVETVGDRGWLVGKHMTWADLAVYTILCNLTSGFLPGVPSDLYVTKYPILEAYRNRIASIPAIKAYFNKPENSDTLRLSFRPADVLVAA